MEIKAGSLPVLLAFISPKSEAMSPSISLYLLKTKKGRPSTERPFRFLYVTCLSHGKAASLG